MSAPESFVPHAADLIGNPGSQPVLIVLLIILSIACFTDLRERRIPNWLTLSAPLVAMALHGLGSGGGATLSSLLSYAGFLVAGFILYSAVLAQGVGAGDIKLLAACAAFLGWMPALYLALFSFAAHVAWMIAGWFREGVALQNLGALGRWLLQLFLPRGLRVPFVPVGSEERSPHAPFVLFAALLLHVLWARGEVRP